MTLYSPQFDSLRHLSGKVMFVCRRVTAVRSQRLHSVSSFSSRLDLIDSIECSWSCLKLLTFFSNSICAMEKFIGSRKAMESEKKRGISEDKARQRLEASRKWTRFKQSSRVPKSFHKSSRLLNNESAMMKLDDNQDLPQHSPAKLEAILWRLKRQYRTMTI
jgi:hypothetical protein